MHWYHIVATYVAIICMITSIPIIVVYMTFNDAVNATATNSTFLVFMKRPTTEMTTDPPGPSDKFGAVIENTPIDPPSGASLNWRLW